MGAQSTLNCTYLSIKNRITSGHSSFPNTSISGLGFRLPYMRIFILSFFLILTVQAAANTNWQTYGVIFRGEQAKALLQQCSRAELEKVSAQWTPSVQQITQLELKLPAYKQKLGRPTAQLSNFYRQYAGFMAGGRKIIYVNLFPKSTDPKWRSRAAVVCDGGEQFWGVEFEVDTGQFVNPAFNGSV
jgi:hypothetical protein